MKIIWVAILISSLMCKFKKSSSHHKSKTHQPKKVSAALYLSTTPKAGNLNDHFGADSQNSQYGPQPRLLRHHVNLTDLNGDQQDTVLTEVVHAPIGYYPCDIHEIDNYELCLNIKDCDYCVANPHCGWCEASLTCFPGNKEYSACAQSCVNGWVFGERSCSDKIRAGRFSNIAPEASDFISPELAQKKYYVRTEIHHPAVVSTPVLLGVRNKHDETFSKNTFTGEVVNHHMTDKIVPIVGQVHQKMDVATLHQQFIDAKTGIRLDEPDQPTFHGRMPY